MVNSAPSRRVSSTYPEPAVMGAPQLRSGRANFRRWDLRRDSQHGHAIAMAIEYAVEAITNYAVNAFDTQGRQGLRKLVRHLLRHECTFRSVGTAGHKLHRLRATVALRGGLMLARACRELIGISSGLRGAHECGTPSMPIFE